MQNTSTTEWTDFNRELLQNIRKTIRSLKRSGTVGMGYRNLRQVTPTPKTLNGAPMGVNCQYAYSEIFAQTLDGLTASERKFIIGY